MSDDVITRDENGDLAVRTVAAAASESAGQYDDLYARTTDGRRALRVVVGGGVAVESVNGQIGAVVLTGADINATLTDGDVSETATVAQHLQTLKDDGVEKGNAIQAIEEKIPENASAINQLVTQADIPSDYLPLSGGTLTGAIKFETNGNITSASNQLWLGAGSGSQVKISTAAMFPGTTSINLGSSFAKWNTIYVQKLNNGATITVPNKVGTLALTADLEDYATSIDLNDVESRVTDIEDKIPEMASSDNKLVTEEDLTAASTSIIIRRW